MNTAVAHHREGRLTKAAGFYQQILTAQPDFADTRHLLGVVALQQGHLADAERQIRQAIALEPQNGESWNNLGVALKKMGRFEDALTALQNAVRHNPTAQDYWINFADCSRITPIVAFDQSLYDTVLACFSRDGIDHRSLTAAATAVLQLSEKTAPLFDAKLLLAVLETWELSGTAPSWMRDPLLLMFLRQTIVCDVRLEHAFTRIRSCLLTFAAGLPTSRSVGSEVQDFASALALQCFFNEYVFCVDESELGALNILRDQIERARPATPSDRLRVAAYACYAPLYQLANANDLASRAEPVSEVTDEMLNRQITEPLIEREIRNEITVIGTAADDVSRAVQNQYEENPYPRWQTRNHVTAQPIHAVLTRLFPGAVIEGGTDNPDILVAGCGTGRQALACAQTYANAQILAIDLSRSSLSYDIRMTGMTGRTAKSHLQFAQADILELACFDRRFDLIECVGVLHYLAEPVTGWRVLRTLLKDRGWMKIGLYSELARQPHIAAQKFVEAHGHPATPEGIRAARRDLMALPASHQASRITERLNFYTLSECRDLIFHVQEHRFTIPQIADALAHLDLEFVGFEFLDSVQVERYRANYPEDPKAVSLDNWNRFELENPAIFLGMYQFWVRALT